MNKVLKILGITALVGAIGYFAYNHFKKNDVTNTTKPTPNPKPPKPPKPSKPTPTTPTTPTPTPTPTTPTTPTPTPTPKKIKVSEDKAKESVVKTNGYTIVKLRDDYKQGGYKTYNESFLNLGNWAMFSDFCKANPCSIVNGEVSDGQSFIVDEMFTIDFGKFNDGHDLDKKTFAILNKQKNYATASLPNGTYAIPLPAFLDTKSVDQLGGNLNPNQVDNTNPLIEGYLKKAAKDYNSFITGKGWDGSYDVITPNFYIPTNSVEGQIASEARQAFDDAWRQKYLGGGGGTRCYDRSTGQYGDCVGDKTLDMS